MSGIRFKGICDVCGGPMDFAYDPETDPMFDHYFNDAGQMVTWVRHYATAPPAADPDCERRASLVVEVTDSTP